MHHRGKTAKNRRSVAAGSPDGALLGAAPYGDLEQRYRSLVADQGFKLGILQTIDGLFKGTLDPATVSHAPVAAGHRHLSRRLTIVMSAIVLLLALLLAGTIFALQPKTVAYSFSQETSCSDDLAILPNIFSSSSANGYTVTREPSFSLGGVPLVTKNVCVTPTAKPVANAKTVQTQALGPLSKSITVSTNAYPAAQPAVASTKLTQSAADVTFNLSQADETFDYVVAYKDKSAGCNKAGTTVTCPTASLNLGAGSTYELNLQRRYKDQSLGTVATAKVQTATPLKISQTSIAEGATLSATTQQITITADRPLAVATNQKITLVLKAADSKATTIPLKLTVSGPVLTAAFDQKLPQPATGSLNVTQLVATDKTTLAKPYMVTFKTTGGPAVVSSTLKEQGMAENQVITITFDQALASGQNPIKLAVLKVNGVAQRAAYSLSGSTITLKPLSNYPKCSTVTVQVTNDVQNSAGQSGSSAWTGSGKVGC